MAYTGMSEEDKRLISIAQQSYNGAKSIGDTAGMADAHNWAESIRAKYGYSGGADGSGYNSTAEASYGALLGSQQNSIYDLESRQRESEQAYQSYMDSIEQRYRDMEDRIAEQNAAAVKQGVSRLASQKSTINQGYDDSARQAYVSSMMSQKALPQMMAAQGLTGGATETAAMGLRASYENNLNSINTGRNQALTDIDNAIIDLQNTGDLSTAEQILANRQQALSAYQDMINQEMAYKFGGIDRSANYLNMYGNTYQNSIDDSWRQKEYDYQTGQDAEGKAEQARSDAYSRALTMIQMGVLPSSDILAAAGISEADARAMVERVNAASYSSGGGGSGGTAQGNSNVSPLVPTGGTPEEVAVNMLELIQKQLRYGLITQEQAAALIEKYDLG